MTTQTQFVSPDQYYNMACQRLADFDGFCKAKCAEREAARASNPPSWWSKLFENFGIDPRSEYPYDWQQDFEYYSQYVMPYREQYKRLTELEVWLAHCINRDLKVQISASDLTLLVGEWK